MSVLILSGFQRSGTTALGAVIADEYHRRGETFTVNGKLAYYLHRWVNQDDLDARHLRVDEILYGLLRRRPLGPGVDAWLGRAERALRWAASIVADGQWQRGPVALSQEIVRRSYGPPDCAWGDKYNEYLLQLEPTLTLVPEARFLVIFRHPADVEASMTKWVGDRPWRPSTPDGVATKWNAWNRRWLEFVAAHPDVPRLLVEYSALCSSPDSQRAVAEFANVSPGRIRESMQVRRPVSSPATIAGDLGATWRQLVEQGANS